MTNHLKYLKKEWVGEVVGCGHSSRAGVAILLHQKNSFIIKNSVFDPEGRYILINGLINDNNITLVNIYAPHDDSFFDEVWIKLAEFVDSIIVIGGDFNLTLYPNINKTGKVVQPKKNCFFYFKSDTNLWFDRYMEDIAPQ